MVMIITSLHIPGVMAREEMRQIWSEVNKRQTLAEDLGNPGGGPGGSLA